MVVMVQVLNYTNLYVRIHFNYLIIHLKNVFGYTNALFGDFNRNTVVSELSQNKPVIMSDKKNIGLV